MDVNDARNQKPQKKNNKAKGFKVEVDDEEVQRQIKETIQRLQGNKGKSTTSKHKRERRELEREKMAQERAAEQEQSKVLKLTEFVTANDLAVMMNVPVTKVIGTCMMLGVITQDVMMTEDAIIKVRSVVIVGCRMLFMRILM